MLAKLYSTEGTLKRNLIRAKHISSRVETKICKKGEKNEAAIFQSQKNNDNTIL